MDFRSLLGNAVDLFGRSIGGIDVGASEAIAGGPTITSNLGSSPQQRETANLWGQAITTPGPTGGSTTTTTPTDPNQIRTPVIPRTDAPGTGGGGGGGNPPGDSRLQQLSKMDRNPAEESEYQRMLEEARRSAQSTRDAEIARERGAISSEFEPIFQELDRQIGMLPEQRQQLEQQLSTLSTSQRADVETNQNRGIEALDKSAETEKSNAADSLRNLEQDVRNQLMSREMYFGAIGAGDSSAPGMASDAVTRGALRARGQVLSTRDEGLAAIETKKQDVRNLATDQFKKIEDWKSNKLFETTQFFTQKLTDLNTQKANASVERQRAINDVIRGLNQQFVSRLQSLDDDVMNFKKGVETWQMQRQGELEDFATKLGIQSSYSTAANKPTYDAALKLFSSLYGTQNLSMSQARQAVLDQTGIDPLVGLELSPNQGQKTKSSLADQIFGGALSTMASGATQ